MYPRLHLSALREGLQNAPAVVLLGPRQVGKTTLALALAEEQPAVYLDLQSPADRAKLDSPELYLAEHAGTLVILDEIHHAPGLFPVLRGLIDKRRRSRQAGKANGQFLLLGSASMDLLRQSGETLAGRVAYLELPPLTLLETGVEQQDLLWLRGGFPNSLAARDDARSQRWRQDFIRTYLERDVPQLGPRIAAESLRRLWTMLAHHQGSMLNVAALARSLGVDGKTVAAWIDLTVDLLLVRRLQPWHANTGKRLVKSPKVWLRDSGLVHTLLGIAERDALLGHPVVGASWECFVIENLLNAAAARRHAVEPSFYRSGAGAEIDLLLTWPSGAVWAVEVKLSLAPKVERGFHSACEDVAPRRRFVVYPGVERYPMSEGLEAISLAELMQLVAAGDQAVPSPSRARRSLRQ